MKKLLVILCGLMLLNLAACSRQESEEEALSEVLGADTIFEEAVEEEAPRDWSIRYDLSDATLSAPYHEILKKRKSWSWQAPTFEERRALYEQSVYRIEKLGELGEGTTRRLRFLIILDEDYEGSENAFWAQLDFLNQPFAQGYQKECFTFWKTDGSHPVEKLYIDIKPEITYEWFESDEKLQAFLKDALEYLLSCEIVSHAQVDYEYFPSWMTCWTVPMEVY